MTVPERLYRWNHWYDQLPQEWRFQVIVWPLIAVGFLNMLLTLAIRFPFGLLLLLGVLCFAAIRIPYALGWIVPAAADPAGEPDAWKFEIPGAEWLIDLNQRYDAMPASSRFWVYPVVLLTAGAINMALTISTGFSFGLLFLLALLALIAIRAPYAAGLLKLPPSAATPVLSGQDSPRITHAPSPMSHAEPRSAEPAMLAAAAPQATQREMRTADFGEPSMPSVDAKAAPPAEHHDNVAVAPAPAPPDTQPEMRTADLGEPSMPLADVKAAPLANDHDSAAGNPSPAPPDTVREMHASDHGEPILPSVEVNAGSPANDHDSLAINPSSADGMPSVPAVEPDKMHATDNQPTPPRNSSRKSNRTQ